MDFALLLESQEGLEFHHALQLVRAAESAGFVMVGRADHLLSVTEGAEGAGSDAWAMVAALAGTTDRIGLGIRVSPVGWRDPGLLALTAATVDRISGGRLHVGVGAGWHEREHAAYGFPFPPLRERFERLEETVEILVSLWTQERTTFLGRHYRLDHAARCAPAASPHPPLVIGGTGTHRTPRLAARHAAEFNAFARPVGEVTAAFARVRDACRQEGRDPSSLVYSQNIVVLVGEDEAEFRHRADTLRRLQRYGGTLEDYLAEYEERWALGTVPQVVEALERRAEAGVERFVVQAELYEDMDMIHLLGRDVLPALR